MKVPWLVDELCHCNHTTFGHLLRLEEAFLVARSDGNLDVVTGHGLGGAHAEDVGEDRNFGGEAEVVVGYSQGHGQALDRLIAMQAFTTTVKREGWDGAGRGRIRQNKTGTEKKEKPDVNVIGRASHAVGGTSVSAA